MPILAERREILAKLEHAGRDYVTVREASERSKKTSGGLFLAVVGLDPFPEVACQRAALRWLAHRESRRACCLWPLARV